MNYIIEHLTLLSPSVMWHCPSLYTSHSQYLSLFNTRKGFIGILSWTFFPKVKVGHKLFQWTCLYETFWATKLVKQQTDRWRKSVLSEHSLKNTRVSYYYTVCNRIPATHSMHTCEVGDIHCPALCEWAHLKLCSHHPGNQDPVKQERVCPA